MSEIRIHVKLSQAEVAKIRTLAARYLSELGEAEMDDEEARDLVRRLSAEGERVWKIRYQQQF